MMFPSPYLFPAQLILVTLAYFVSGKFGLSIAHVGSQITLFWLPTGIAVAALVRWGWRCWPAVFLGAFLVNLASGVSCPVALGIALGNTLAPLLAALLLKRCEFRSSFDRPKDVLLFFVSAFSSMLVSSAGGVCVLWLSGIVPWNAFPEAFLAWWMGDAMGVLLAGPLLLVITRKNLLDFWLRRKETAILISIMLALGWLAFSSGVSYGMLPATFLFFPLLIWFALSYGFPGASIAAMLISLLAAVSTSMGKGSFSQFGTQHELLWAFMSALVLSGFLVATLLAARRQAENALIRSEQNLILAQAVAEVGSWHLDIATSRLEWTPESFRIFGIPKRESVDLDTFLSTVHPDDRQRVLKAWSEAIAGAPYDIEHRVVADGKTRWVRERAEIVRNEKGRAIAGIGTTQDITERLRRDTELQRLERTSRSLAENLPDIVSRFDRQFRRIYANPQLERATGMPMESLLGKSHDELEVPNDLMHIWNNVLRRVFSTGQTEVFEFEFSAVGGGVDYYQGIAVPEYDASGEVETVLSIARNISTMKINEMKLRESEERLHAIASNVPGMVIQCCRVAGEDRFKFTYVSDGARDLLGLDAEAILKNEREFTDRITGEYAKTFYDSMVQSQSEQKLWNWEGCVVAGDGSLKWINLRAVPHPQGGAMCASNACYVADCSDCSEVCGADMCIWNGVVINITESKANEKKLVDSQRLMRELASHLDSVREDELKRVAREIHDEMGQALTALKMDVSLARIGFGKSNPQLMERLQSMTQLVDRTIMIARHITSSLRPGALDLGIVAALEWQVHEFTGYTGIPCKLVLGDGDMTLSESVAMAVFRIVQESLTNIARHAEATKVEIILSKTRDHFCLEVCDNGKGFDPKAPARQDSFGLVGMRERMAILQGDFRLDSGPGRGTRVRMCVPLSS